MTGAIRPAGEVLLKFLESEQGRKALGEGAKYGLAAARKGGQALGKFGSMAGRAAEEAVLTGGPAAAKFAERFVDKPGLVGKVAERVATTPTDQIINAAVMAGQVAKPVSQAVAVLGTGAFVGGALAKPETAYSTAMDTIAAREASAYGIIDAKLQADAARQLGNQELAAQKFQQALYLQDQRQKHDLMIAQAREEARTPYNQPMSGSKLFDQLTGSGGIFGGTNQY